MNRSDKILAFEGIEIDLLRGSLKNKEITKLFITGMTYKALEEARKRLEEICID